MPSSNHQLLNAAFAYTTRGLRVIPIPAGRKGPVAKGWNALRLDPSDLPHHFNGSGNIGVLLGEPSGWLVDVDLDCEEARELADDYLPNTAVVTGRSSSPGSHRWYIAEGAISRRHVDPVTEKCIVELRSTGLQTLIGPSIHPSGEPYDHLDGIPPRVDAADLATRVAALAAAVVARRHGDLAARAERGPTSRPTAGLRAEDAVERRAEAYLDAMPPAISGQGGHGRTFAAATALVHGFGLSPNVAFRMLIDRYNPRCVPPWSERELQHKVDDAATKPHARPRGCLRDATPAESNDVDLSGFDLHAKRDIDDPSDEPIASPPPDPGPLPDELLDVPGFIGDVMSFNLMTATRPQPVLALAAAICLQATLAGRKVRDERGNRTNLYCVGIAPSGAGKDHARKVNKNVLFQSGLEALEGNEDVASDAGLVAAIEASPAGLFQFDEFGRFLRTIGDPKKAPHLFNVLTALMKLYSSADTTFKGKAYADMKRNKTIDQPCAVVYGTTVPEHFFESLTAESLADGFVARLLVFEATANAQRQVTTVRPIPEPIIEAARWWGDFKPSGNLRDEHPDPLEVRTTPDAGAEFDRLASVVDAELGGPHAGASSLWARAEEKACRLALIYACSANRERMVIDQDAARWACRLAEYLTRRMLFVAHEWVADGFFDQRQKRVLRIIRQMGGTIGRRELSRRTQSMTQRERQEVVENLLETGRIALVTTQTATRPRVVYALR